MKRSETQSTPSLEAIRTAFQKVMAEIGAGNRPTSAMANLSASVLGLRQTVSEAERLHSIAMQAAQAMAGSMVQEQAAAPAPSRRRKLSGKAERSREIRLAAAELAAKSGGKVDIDGVNNFVVAKGIDLDTKVPGTMIGNVLNKSPDWKRVHKGVYEVVSAGVTNK